MKRERELKFKRDAKNQERELKLKSEYKRELTRQRNEPPVLTRREEIFNAASHGAGIPMAAACMMILLSKSDTAWKIAAALIYGISMLFMMSVSCIYHAMPTGSNAKRICRRFDYASIYLLIGGTFAPILLVYLGGKPGVALFCAQWCVIITGVWITLTFGPGRWRWLPFALYFTLGWSGLGFIKSFHTHAPILLWFILMGGLAYTLGMIPFARKRKYDHCAWHIFVLAGAVLQWLGICTQIY